MKNIYLFLVIALTSSCVEDILDTKPLDALTTEQAFVTEGNLKMYIGSLYQMPLTLPTRNDIFGQGSTGLGIGKVEWAGDNIADITSTAVYSEHYYTPGVYKASDEEFWLWDELRRINFFLDNYKKSEAPEQVKNHYAGIARWFRAKFYFEMVKRFGDVPWYGSTLGSNDPELYKARDSRTLVMDSVLADLNFAIANINSQKDNTCSTVTKWVALGLKSRICLFEGTFRKYHPEYGLAGTANTWLQHAADAAEQIMDSGQYSIYSTGNPEEDYHDLFISDNAISDEIMLAHVHSESFLVFHGSTNFYSNTGGRYMTCLTKRFINTYLNIDGSRFTDISEYDTIFFTDEVKNRDFRLSQTIRTPSYVRLDGSTPAPFGAFAPTYYHPIKWSHPDPYFDDVSRNVNDITLMRYAEILLNYAEAKAELETFTENDWDNTIGLLRKRAGITDTSMPTTLCTYMKDNFYENVNSIPIMEVRRERAIELVYEKFRWDDLIRWREAHNVEKRFDGIYVPQMDKLYDLTDDGHPDVSFVTKKPDNPEPGVFYMIIDDQSFSLSEGTKGTIIIRPNQVFEFPDYKYLKPIPLRELQLNPNLVQNTGWE